MGIYFKVYFRKRQEMIQRSVSMWVFKLRDGDDDVVSTSSPPLSLIIDVKYDSTPVAASMCLLVRFIIVWKSDSEFVVHCVPQKSEFQVRKSEEPRQPQVCSTAAPSTRSDSCVFSHVVQCQVVPTLPAHVVLGFSLTTYPVLRHQLLANNANDSNVHVSFPVPTSELNGTHRWSKLTWHTR